MIAIASAREVFINLSRAGVAKNKSRTLIKLPEPKAAGITLPLTPASTSSVQAWSAPIPRLVIVNRLTAPMAGRASPRNPSQRISVRSSPCSLEVTCLVTASGNSSAVMPRPSSATDINVLPPSRNAITISLALASTAFSSNSLTAAAGRSTTSPAAILLTNPSGKWRSSVMLSLTHL